MTKAADTGGTVPTASVVAEGQFCDSYPSDRSPFVRFVVGAFKALLFTASVLFMLLLIACVPIGLAFLFLMFV